MFKSIRGYYRTAVGDLRYQSVEVLLWRVLVKLLSPVLRIDVQILFDMDLTQPVKLLESRLPCVVDRAGEADLDAILDMQMRLLPPEQLPALSDADELTYAHMLRVRADVYRTYQQQLRAGEHCYVARVGGQIAHSNWIRLHDCGPTQNSLVALAPGEVYSTDGFTAEEFRGQKVHQAVATHMLRVAQDLGCHRAYTITDITKAGSRRGVKRIGWKWRGVILYLTPRGLKRTWMMRLGGDLQPLFEHAQAVAGRRQP